MLADQPLQVANENKVWKRTFTTANLPTYWTVTTGSGQTVSATGGALVIQAGTAVSETIVQSVESFTLPLRVQWSEMQSQRIAGNEFYLELVNAAGTTYTGFMFDGTTNTLAKTTHANGGISTPASPTGAVTVGASSGSTPTVREIEARVDAILFSDRSPDSLSNGAARLAKSRTTLDPNEPYFVRIRVKNSSAPASNTTYTIESVVVQDDTRISAEISAGRGQNTLAISVPVAVQNSPTVNANVTANACIAPQVSTAQVPPTILRIDALLATAQTIKASAGRLYFATIYNPNASMAAVHFYNATAPTVGTTTPIYTVAVPAGQTMHVELGGVPLISGATALTVAATTTATTAGAVAPTTALTATFGWI